MKTILITSAIILGSVSLMFYTWAIFPRVPTSEKMAEKSQIQQIENEKHTNYLTEQESRRKTMLLKEEIRKECQLVSQEKLDAENISVGEYVGAKIGLRLLLGI